MSDLIRIVDLEVWSRLGVPEPERAQPQRLLINLEIRVDDFGKAAATEDIAETVDYAAVANYAKNYATERSRHLLETFAQQLADGLLNAFPIKKLRLEVKKFALPNTGYVAVEIERKARKKKKAAGAKGKDQPEPSAVAPEPQPVGNP
jgi:dihydroneopterin aldolase